MSSRKDFTFRSRSLQSRSFIVFQEMKRRKEFCDVTFRFDNKCISAHSVIVAATVPYFRDRLSERAEDKEIDVFEADIDPDAFESILEFAYSCEITITVENVRNLLSGAHYLGIEEIREACCDFLTDNLDPENVLDIRDFTCKLKYPDLAENIDQYIKQHFFEMSNVKNFLDLSFTEFKDLISSNDLHVSSEEKVFEAVIKWVKRDPHLRRDVLPELLKAVRMPLLSPQYLKDCVAREDFIRMSLPCRDLLDEARNYHFFPEERTQLCNFTIQSRHFSKNSSTSDSKGLMYMIDIAVPCTALYFRHMTKTWQNQGSKTFRFLWSSVAIGSKIYFFRGSDAFKYDTSKKIFEHIGQMLSDRLYTAVTSVRNKIFVCGGKRSDGEPTNAVECYDPETNKWTVVTSMRERRSFPGAATLNDSIYVLGGAGSNNIHSSVERYDSRTNKWRPSSAMLNNRCAPGSATLNGRIYVCGGLISGDKCTSTAEVYDPDSNQWQLISSMKTERWGFYLLSYNGDLFAVGGVKDSGNSETKVEIYDCKMDKWEFGSSIDSKLHISAAAVIPLSS